MRVVTQHLVTLVCEIFMVTHDVGTCFVSSMKLRITKILTPDFYNARVLRPPAFMISRVWGTRHDVSMLSHEGLRTHRIVRFLTTLLVLLPGLIMFWKKYFMRG